jgi:thiamine-phosphate pyrophosphorylase
MSVDLRLYALIDPERANGRDLAELARLVVDGGATLVQLRDKTGNTRQLIEEARAIRAVLTGTSAPFLVNDRVDVALAAKADGIHIGWEDIAPVDARLLLGANAIIGLSIKTMQQAQSAPLELLNYVCVGGVYQTMSKDNPDPPIGADGLRAIATVIRRRAPHMPVGAIAGIDESNAAETIAANADGVAIISALSMAPDPRAAAKKLRMVIDDALAKRGAA